jgi:hypothetical protein
MIKFTLQKTLQKHSVPMLLFTGIAGAQVKVGNDPAKINARPQIDLKSSARGLLFTLFNTNDIINETI